MLQKYLEIFNSVKPVLLLGASIYALDRIFGGAARLYDTVDTGLDSIIDPVSGAVFTAINDFSEPLTYGDFSLSLFKRHHFSTDWVMLPDAALYFRSAYPTEMVSILTSGNVLLPEYRGGVTL